MLFKGIQRITHNAPDHIHQGGAEFLQQAVYIGLAEKIAVGREIHTKLILLLTNITAFI